MRTTLTLPAGKRRDLRILLSNGWLGTLCNQILFLGDPGFYIVDAPDLGAFGASEADQYIEGSGQVMGEWVMDFSF
ncbi:MAG: hypothetical protein IH860_05915 [Chloroflexi bacterium]|nr:hypothetical protein [Chloroflexota bacterium]